MNVVLILLQIVVALGLINVWVLRSKRSTPYRGGSASNMREEFAAYGLSSGTMKVVGTLKMLCAICLLLGLWIHSLVIPAASLLALLMIGAIVMHVKVKDPLQKSVPAVCMLLMSIGIVLLAR